MYPGGKDSPDTVGFLGMHTIFIPERCGYLGTCTGTGIREEKMLVPLQLYCYLPRHVGLEGPQL